MFETNTEVVLPPSSIVRLRGGVAALVREWSSNNSSWLAMKIHHLESWNYWNSCKLWPPKLWCCLLKPWGKKLQQLVVLFAEGSIHCKEEIPRSFRRETKFLGSAANGKCRFTSWWFKPIWNILVKCQLGLFPEVGVSINNFGNHHLVHCS